MPFIELHGESTEYVGRAEDAIIALSNYRLHIKFKESVVNVSASSCSDLNGNNRSFSDSLLLRMKKPFPHVQIDFSGTISMYIGTRR